jgi:multidrug efflux system membrane fusion protein
VATAAAVKGDIAVRLPALGTSTSGVTVKAQVSGQLEKVTFTALTTAQCKLARDQALLAGSGPDVRRAVGAPLRQAVTQRASVTQDIIETDKAAVVAAQVKLGYTHVLAPVSGRVGLRQVDPGNYVTYVTAADANGIVVIAELQPTSALFALPEDDAVQIFRRLSAGALLPVTILDRRNRRWLGQGRLVGINNQVDTNTGTVTLRAHLDGTDGAPFPAQYVNVQLLVDTLHDQVLIPGAAVRRDGNGPFVYVVAPGTSTVRARTVRVGVTDGDSSRCHLGRIPRGRCGDRGQRPSARRRPGAAAAVGIASRPGGLGRRPDRSPARPREVGSERGLRRPLNGEKPMRSRVMRFSRIPAFMLLVVLSCTSTGQAQHGDTAVTAAGLNIVTTRHSIVLGGRALRYTARAGFIPIFSQHDGEVHAEIFFVSYKADARRLRPLTFVTAGGPGEPATLSDLGPRISRGVHVQGYVAPPSQGMMDNPETWLAMTDLVLIDPVGSGYSRATRDEYAAEYYNPEGDADSVAQFIRRYLQIYEGAVQRPAFAAGVSYGAIRTALVADILAQHEIPLRGVVLAASALAGCDAVADFLPGGRDSYYVQVLPTLTASAYFHRKLSTSLQQSMGEALDQAEAWATGEYSRLLAQSDALTGGQLDAAAVQMARLTGVRPEVLQEHRLRLHADAFLRELLGPEFTGLGLLDARRTRLDDPKPPDPGEEQTPFNPFKVYDALASLYLAGELQFKTQASYDAGFLTLARGWQCPSANCFDAEAFARLQRAMRASPRLRVMITSGYYDLNCPYLGTKLALKQLEPGLRARVQAVYYQAGHFLPPEHRAEVARFIGRALATSGRNEQP